MLEYDILAFTKLITANGQLHCCKIMIEGYNMKTESLKTNQDYLLFKRYATNKLGTQHNQATIL